MIDILLSTYNGEKYLEQQLDSILSQDYDDFTVLIRDDCSSDKTVEIIHRYASAYPHKIEIIQNDGKNLGSTNSFLTLLKMSRSELIMFCDQDDVWNNNKISLMYEFYKVYVSKKDEPFLIHSAVEIVDENLSEMPAETTVFNKEKCGMDKPFLWQVFQNDVTGCTVLTNSAMRKIIAGIDLNSSGIIQHDWLLAQIAWLYRNKYFLPQKTMKYRQHSMNVRGGKRKSAVHRIFGKFGHKPDYPYYGQIATLLDCCGLKEFPEKDTLLDFSSLMNKNKVCRIYWHIRNNFFRVGNIFYKLYQLAIC